MRSRIRHNYPSLIHCLRAFYILFFAYLLFRCYCYNYYKNPKTFIFTFATVNIIIIPPFATKYFAADTKLSRCGWIDNSTANTQEYLWLPLCRINKFGLNTLPSKAVVIPYTCGLSIGLVVVCSCYHCLAINSLYSILWTYHLPAILTFGAYFFVYLCQII